jgi:hypothetical protein
VVITPYDASTGRIGPRLSTVVEAHGAHREGEGNDSGDDDRAQAMAGIADPIPLEHRNDNENAEHHWIPPKIVHSLFLGRITIIALDIDRPGKSSRHHKATIRRRARIADCHRDDQPNEQNKCDSFRRL